MTGPVPPGQTAVVFLSQGSGALDGAFCPSEVTPALTDTPIIYTSGTTKSFHLSTSKPVGAYSIYPYGGAASFIPSATLLFPTSAWTTNYIAVDGFPGILGTVGAGAVPSFPRTFLQVVAQDDDTEVRMLPVSDVVEGDGFPAGTAGATQTWHLSRGQVVQFLQNTSLAGSAIESSKPVGLFGGTECTDLPFASTYACDTLDQQIPPLGGWGSEYALVPYPSRLEGGKGTSREITGNETVPYRIVGAVDGTELTYDPVIPIGAPRVLGKGQVTMFMSNEYVTVKSQDAAHPFYVAVFMTGSTFNGTQTYGDPDFVNLVPSEQFLDRYVFATDFTYADTNLTVVRRKAGADFQPVTLDCAGEITGFRPLGSNGDYEYAFVRLTSFRTPQVFDAGTCSYGSHEIKSDGPFGVTVWGIDICASYGYPGGMGLRSLNTVTVEAPAVH